jgi:hypothetical protein
MVPLEIFQLQELERDSKKRASSHGPFCFLITLLTTVRTTRGPACRAWHKCLQGEGVKGAHHEMERKTGGKAGGDSPA